MTIITRAWADLAPKLIAFLGGGLTPALLLAAYTWAADAFGWTWQPSTVLVALVVTGLATIAGWFKADGALAGRTWSEISPKLLTLFVSSGIITVLVAIAAELGFEPPAVAVAFFTALAPLIPGYVKADTLFEGGVTSDGAYVVTTAEPPRHLAT